MSEASRGEILLIDDDTLVGGTLASLFKNTGIQIVQELTAIDGLRRISENPRRFPVVIIDYNLPDMQGHSVVKRLKEIEPSITSFIWPIIYSGNDTREATAYGLKAGAADFWIKSEPGAQELYRQKIIDEIDYRRKHLSHIFWDSEKSKKLSESLNKFGLIGQSESMLRIAVDIKRFATTPYNLLILGETGTGKELTAKAIHKVRGQGPFLAINCADFTGDTARSELFGHEKGAFTGASELKRGAFEEANGGVLFLDELHCLNKDVQGMLLRVLQERKVRRVGGIIEIPFEVKLIVATKPNLSERVESGEFLEDLMHRINNHQIYLPALKDRLSDIELLVDAFVKKHGEQFGKKISFSAPALQKLSQYRWDGNIRELENFIIKCLSASENGQIAIEQIDNLYRRNKISAVDGAGKGFFHSGLQFLNGMSAKFIKKYMREMGDDIAERKIMEELKSNSVRKVAKLNNMSHTSVLDIKKKWDAKVKQS